MVRLTILIAAILLSGCSSADFNQAGHVPTYRHTFVNGSANSEYEPPNSMPR